MDLTATACPGKAPNLGSGKFLARLHRREIVKIHHRWRARHGNAAEQSLLPEDRRDHCRVSAVAGRVSHRGPTIPGDVRVSRPTLFEGKDSVCRATALASQVDARPPGSVRSAALAAAVELHPGALVDPSADIRSDSRQVTAVTRDGTTISGRLLNQDT